MKNEDHSPASVAAWMLTQVKRNGCLYQETAVSDIESKFGEEFVYYNDRGSLAIGKPVLNAFRKLTDDSVVWQKTDRCWRLREDGDEPGRRQS